MIHHRHTYGKGGIGNPFLIMWTLDIDTWLIMITAVAAKMRWGIFLESHSCDDMREYVVIIMIDRNMCIYDKKIPRIIYKHVTCMTLLLHDQQIISAKILFIKSSGGTKNDVREGIRDCFNFNNLSKNGNKSTLI
jgi:hypothetical protein